MLHLPNKGFPDRRKFACKSSKDSLVPNLELEPTGKESERRPANQFNGIFLLLTLNIGIYVADHILHVSIGQDSVLLPYHADVLYWTLRALLQLRLWCN